LTRGGLGAYPHKNFENLDAKSCNLRVFWSENVFPKKTVLKVETDIMWSIAASLIGRVDTNSGNICGDLEN
jgi:hypothetical protein